MRPSESMPSWVPTAFVAALAAVVASLSAVGGDMPWLVAVGSVVAHGRLPHSVPTAAASTAGWHDALAGGQLVVWGAYRALGARGFVVLQVLASATAFGALAYGLRRQGSSGGTLAASLLVLLGVAPSVLIARVSLFSFALFPVLVLLVQEDARSPSRRLWLVVPLLALWANLHGMVLAGVAVLGGYLVVSRARRTPAEAGGMLAASLLALCLTPELWRTPLYYRAVFDNEAAARHAGLWAPLGLHPFDVIYVVAALTLVACARARLQPWEWVVCAALAAYSVHTARVGVFLLFVLAYPAARRMRVRAPHPVVLVSAACSFAVLAPILVGPAHPAANTALARRAAATHDVVLADPTQGEWVELFGGRIWVGNPIDAFRRSDQALYLDWASGERSGRAAVGHARLVLVDAKSPAGRAAARDRRLRRLDAVDGAVLYAVKRS